jgi:FtsP/CotA-like multicopper oxidase with cupredoxin domain
MRPFLVPALALLAIACPERPPQPTPEADTGLTDVLKQPEGWDTAIAMPQQDDLNPDPTLFELNLEAKVSTIELDGTPTTMWTYNGQLPGPVIRSKVGDTVIVHFKNSLPEPTTIHWHGVKVPAAMDGSEATQHAVQPGATFDYRFTTPEAGLFWYHPHVNSSAQVGHGLYGAFVVTDPDEPFLGDELVLVLSDASPTDGGMLAEGDESGWFGDYFGREGSLLLVNGKTLPSVKARAGVPQRWKVVNTSRARYYQVRLPVEVTRIGGDVGLISEALPGNDIVLTPGERMELWVRSDRPSTHLPVQWVDANRFHISGANGSQTVMWLDTTDAAKVTTSVKPSGTLRTIAPLDLSAAPLRKLELMEKELNGVRVLGINGLTWGESMNSPLMVHVGATEQWEIYNSTLYDHTFHLHGYSFQPISLAGKPWPVREWKDSINVPAGQKLLFAVKFEDRPGMWMLHCHILDHINLGMMAMLHVMP